MEKIESTLEDLIKKVSNDSFVCSVSLYSSIEEQLPSFRGLPMHYSYAPVINIKMGRGTEYVIRQKGDESPDEMLLCLRSRVKAYELALKIVEKLSDKKKAFNNYPIDVKIDDLPIPKARELIELYQKELAEVEESHKKYKWE